MITQERLKELLSYDPETGLFRWLVDIKRGCVPGFSARVGDIAGAIDSKGYRIIKIDRKCYRANRLAYFYMTGSWPKRWVDHRDTDRSNDRWENLRDATPAQNGANKRAYGKLGVKGVTLARNGKYQVQITVDGRSIYLGTTDNLALAGYMYEIAAAGYHRDFARAA